MRGGLLRSWLPPRTLVGFAVAILAILAMAFVSYRMLRSRAEATDRMAHTLRVEQEIEAVVSTFKDAETGQRGYLLTGDDRYLAPYDSAVVALPEMIAILRDLLSADPAQTQRLNRLDRIGAQKLAELKRTVDLGRAGRAGDALAIVREDHGKVYMDQLRALADEMREAERTLLDARTRDWEAVTALSTIVSLGGAFVLLFLITVAAAMTSRDFRTQRLQAWLRTGQNGLAERMQGDQDVQRLGDSIAGYLASYVDAQVGAVHFTETSDHLVRVGAFALPTDASREPGGLTAQVMADGTLLQVPDVPADYFTVSSGLGKSRPRHLVVAPISADGAANGTVELGFFRPVPPHVVELLQRVAEPVGLALLSARYRREVRDLLAETQRQAEELQAQQEELRVQNEELESQSRILQESQARLENQQVELEQINTQLEEQTQALERQRDDLRRAQGELERASLYKSEFLANVSHELRTPLNSTLILAKLLVDNRDGNLTAEQIKFARSIYSAGNDLLTLINDILDLSKIEAGMLDVRPESVSIGRMVDELVNGFQPVARDKRLQLSTAVAEGIGTIFSDPTRLQQILKNLLSNAFKFTEEGGVSLLVERRRDGRLAFEVKDTGIGIPPEQHQLIFEAFRQGDGGADRRHGGTGLGLSISRDLAELLGGEITLESAVGRGSTFTLLLPETYVPPASVRQAGATLPPLPRAATRSTAPISVRAAASTSPLGPPRPASEAAAGAPPLNGSRPILIIEDDAEFARVLYELAEELDFSAVIAENAEKGLEMAERVRPSAIVLDIGLPDRSGLSVLDVLKHNPALRHIPVHVVSVDDFTQTALEMGAASYAIKPVPREQLGEALKRLEAKFTQKLRRVLVVEDNETQRDATSQLLAGDDVETVAVGTAAAALAALASQTFDCIVLDLTLPDRTGFDLLDEMSQKDQYSFPPVVVYTGRSLTRDEEQRLRRYSSSIIIKGARSPERLLDEVTLFLHQVEAKLPPDRQRMLRDARHREAVFENRRVLIVEDDVRNIFALSSVLEPKGIKVEIARNGREALDHLRKSPGVDLVLMDIMMPEMDGLQATRAIRKQPELAKLPIIALTAKAMADDREQCLAAGANDYVAKPFEVQKLLSLVRVWMPK